MAQRGAARHRPCWCGGRAQRGRRRGDEAGSGQLSGVSRGVCGHLSIRVSGAYRRGGEGRFGRWALLRERESEGKESSRQRREAKGERKKFLCALGKKERKKRERVTGKERERESE
jgi:hypothetical protein